MIVRIARSGAYCAAVLLLFVAVLTSLDVACRFLFDHPIEQTFEIVETLFVYIIFLGLPAAFLEAREIRVDIFTQHVKGRSNNLLTLLSLLLSAAFFILILWYGARNFLRAWSIGDVGMGQMRVPIFIPWAGVLIGSFLTLLVIASRVVGQLRSLLLVGNRQP